MSLPNEISESDYNNLLEECKTLTEFRDYRMYDYISILFNTVLDFQMKSPSVAKAVDYYENNNRSKIRKNADIKRILSEYPNTRKSNTRLANYLWNNNHWSRAKLLRELVKFFEDQNIRGFKSLKKWIKTAQFEDIEGLVQVRDNKTGKVIHSIGPVLFEWLRLRLGEKTVKADVHVKNFVSETLGYSLNHNVIVEVLIIVAKDMNVEPRELDAAIWHRMSDY